MKKGLIFLFLMSLVLPKVALADEIEMRRQINSDVKSLLTYEEFNHLEEISSYYLKKKSRTPSGIWMLSVLSGAINQLSEDAGNEDKRWNKIFEKIEKWLYKYPDSSSALIAKGVLLTNYAWQIRGSKFASEVPKKKWPKFFAALKVAKKYMLSIKDKADYNPEWYVAMIDILKGLNEDEAFMELLDEAMEKHPTYYQIYFRATEFLKPKWGGSLQKIEQFASDVAKKSARQEGMGMYARLYWYIYGNETQEVQQKFFKEYNVVWDKMKQGMYDVLEQYPDPWNLNNFAFFACQVKDKETTKDLTDQLEEPDMKVWEVRSRYENCKRWANGQPIEEPQDSSQVSYMNMMLNQWFEQLSYVFTAQRDFEGYVQGIAFFYNDKVTTDYRRDVKIKYQSVCEADKKPEDKMDKVQTMSQTKDEFMQTESSVNLQKGYKTYEHSFSSMAFDEKKLEATLNYTLKLEGNMKQVGGFAGSEVESFPMTEFRSCSAIFVMTEDNLAKMRFENCEILIQKGCREEAGKK